MTPEEQKCLSDKVRNHFSAERIEGRLDKPPASLYIQFFGQKQKGSEDPPIELLSGSPTIAGMVAIKFQSESSTFKE